LIKKKNLHKPKEEKNASYFGTFIYLASFQEKNENLASKCHLIDCDTAITFDDDEILLKIKL